MDPLPAANVITGTSAICAGSTLVAYGVTTDNSATASYAWSYSGTNATLSSVTGASITIDFADDATSGILTVVETFTATGCSTTNTYAITVDPLPAANAITGTSAICAGSTLVAYGVTTDNSATASYAWSYSGTNATLSSVTGASITIDFADDATSGTLTVIETFTATGCSTTNTYVITVNTLVPVSVAISEDVNPICSGEAVTITATPVNEGSTPSYQWLVNGSNAGNDSPILSYVPADGDIITVVLTSSETCQTGSPATSNPITMVVTPKPSVLITDPAALCAATTVDLTDVSITTGSTAGISFSYWTDAAATIAYATPAAATAATYYIKGTDPVSGCFDIKPVTVTINAPVSVVVTESCRGVCAGNC